MRFPLTPGERRSLEELHAARQVALSVVVRHPCRVVGRRFGPVRDVGAKDACVWLRLVAKGLVAGGDGKLRLTAEGVRALQEDRPS